MWACSWWIVKLWKNSTIVCLASFDSETKHNTIPYRINLISLNWDELSNALNGNTVFQICSLCTWIQRASALRLRAWEVERQHKFVRVEAESIISAIVGVRKMRMWGEKCGKCHWLLFALLTHKRNFRHRFEWKGNPYTYLSSCSQLECRFMYGNYYYLVAWQHCAACIGICMATTVYLCVYQR